MEWQRLPTNGAVKATFFKSDLGAPMLVIANSRAQAVIYTMDAFSGVFKPTSVQGLNYIRNLFQSHSIKSINSI